MDACQVNFMIRSEIDVTAINAHAEEAAELLSALANAKRLMILCNLLKSEMAVMPLADAVGMNQSALSQHLAKLRAFGLVKTRRDRQMIDYSCDSQAARRLLVTVEQIYGTIL